jgi:hypothetical protein
MRLPGTDLYKIGFANCGKGQKNAVPRRYKTFHKEFNSFLFPEGTKALQLELMRVLPVTEFHFSDGKDRNAKEFCNGILAANHERNTTDYWLDASAMCAEQKFHQACGAFRVTVPDAVTVKGGRTLTEFFRFTPAEAAKVRQAFETSALPQLPKPGRQRKLELSVAYFRNLGSLQAGSLRPFPRGAVKLFQAF